MNSIFAFIASCCCCFLAAEKEIVFEFIEWTWFDIEPLDSFIIASSDGANVLLTVLASMLHDVIEDVWCLILYGILWGSMILTLLQLLSTNKN